MHIKIIKTILGFIYVFSGSYYLIRKLKKNTKKLPIIMYHSIREHNKTIPSCLDIIGMTVSKENFDKQIKFISNNYRVFSIGELIEEKNKNNLDNISNALAITFDDGFYDNYFLAASILKKYGVKATIFLIGDAVISGNMIWQHKIYHIIDEIYENNIQINCKNKKVVTRHKAKVVKRLRNFVDSLQPIEKTAFIKEMEKAFPLSKKTRNTYLSENEIKILLQDGFDFGAHSMQHFDLTDLDCDAIKNEINLSKNIIDSITGKNCMAFAYPRGVSGSWNYRVINELKKNDFKCGLTTIEGLADLNSNMYELNRIEIRDFNKYELFLHITGVIGSIKSYIKKLLRKLTKSNF